MTAKRRYEPIWERLKEDREVEVIIQPSSLKDYQIKRQARTVRKAITKEKYQDIDFRKEFPFAELESFLHDRVLSFKLVLNSANPFKDF